MIYFKRNFYYGLLFYRFLELTSSDILIEDKYRFVNITMENLSDAFKAFHKNNLNHDLNNVFNDLISDDGFLDYRFDKVYGFIESKSIEEIRTLLNNNYYKQFSYEKKFEDELLVQLINKYVPNLKTVLAINSKSIRLFNKLNNFENIKFTTNFSDNSKRESLVKIFNYTNQNSLNVDSLDNPITNKLYDVIIYEPEGRVSSKDIIDNINKFVKQTNYSGLVITKAEQSWYSGIDLETYNKNLLGIIDLPDDELDGFIRLPWKQTHMHRKRYDKSFLVHSDNIDDTKFLIDLKRRQTKRHHLSEDDDLYKYFAKFVIKLIEDKKDRKNLIKFVPVMDDDNNYLINHYINYDKKSHANEGLYKLDQSNTFNFEEIEKINDEVVDLLVKISKSSTKNFLLTRNLILD